MRRFLVVGVVLACLVEGFLFVKVLRDRADGPDPAGASATPTSERPDTEDPTPNTQGPAGVLRLRMSDDGYLIRSWRGSCSEPGRTKLEISPDGGASFNEVALPVVDEGSKTPSVRALLAINARTRDEMTIVGSDADCKTVAFETEDGGKSWQSQDKITGWYLNATGAEVGIDGAVTRPGCSVLRVAPVNEQNAKVLCDDGDIVGTNDLGAEWAVLGTLRGGVDISFASLRDGFGLRRTSDCVAQLASTADAGNSWDTVSCVAKKAAGAADSMTAAGGRIFVQVAGEVYVSTDTGKTWTKAGSE